MFWLEPTVNGEKRDNESRKLNQQMRHKQKCCVLTFVMAYSQNNQSKKRGQDCKNYCCLCTISAADHAGNRFFSSIMCLIYSGLSLHPRLKNLLLHVSHDCCLLSWILKPRERFWFIEINSSRSHMRIVDSLTKYLSVGRRDPQFRIPLFSTSLRAKRQVQLMTSFHCWKNGCYGNVLLQLPSFLSDWSEIWQVKQEMWDNGTTGFTGYISQQLAWWVLFPQAATGRWAAIGSSSPWAMK